jgi:hypothetical protein
MTLTPAERALFLDMSIDAHTALLRYAMLRFPAAAVKHATVATTLTDSDAVRSWAKVASFVLTELKWVEKERPLVPAEDQMRAIAERVYDSCVVAARQLGIDLHPEDTDREAARRDLNGAYASAVFLLDVMQPKKPKEN